MVFTNCLILVKEDDMPTNFGCHISRILQWLFMTQFSKETPQFIPDGTKTLLNLKGHK